MVDFDAVLMQLNEFGRYQKFVVFLISIPACLLNAFNGFVLAFLTYTPDFSCTIDNENKTNNLTQSQWINQSLFVINDDQCAYKLNDSNILSNNSFPCDAYDYDKTYFDSTLITRWDLVCDRTIYPKLGISLLELAAVVGCYGLSFIQDRWGRKIAVLLNITLYLLGSCLSLAMPSFITFIIIRAIAHLPAISMFNVAYILALEYVGPSKRTLISTFYGMMYALATMSVGVIAYLARGWLQIGLVTSVPFMLLFSYQFLIMESPRWLLSEGKTDDAVAVIRRMARWEGTHLSDAQARDLLTSAPRALIKTATNTPKLDEVKVPSAGRPTVLDLFRGKNLRAKTCIITFSWVANAVGYYAIAYNIENIGGNLFLTYILQAAMELPANVLNLLILNRIGRVIPLSISMTISGIACLLAAPGELIGAWFVVCMAMIGKFGICVSFSIIYQLAAELYPTVLRGLGTGFSSIVGDSGNILMPFIVHSAVVYKSLPMLILGSLSVTGGIASFFLPETLGQYMPETIEEAETHGKVGLLAARGHISRIKSWFANSTVAAATVNLNEEFKLNGVSKDSVN